MPIFTTHQKANGRKALRQQSLNLPIRFGFPHFGQLERPAVDFLLFPESGPVDLGLSHPECGLQNVEF
jgi:hypothetical protein